MKRRVWVNGNLEAFRRDVVEHAGGLQELSMRSCRFCQGVVALVLAMAELTPEQLDARAREYFENVHE